MKTYRLAKQNEINEIAALLTDSFIDYPLFSLLLEQGSDFKKQLYKLNYTNAKSYHQKNSCFVGLLDGKIVSAVLLKKSGEKSPGFLQYLFNGGLALATQVGIKRIIHILETLDKMKEACDSYGKDIWYIDTFAVAKGYQGKSLGSALFHEYIFPYVSKNGGGKIMLVTHTELNKKFYCKNGFEVFSEYGIGANTNVLANYSFQLDINAHRE